MTIDEMIERYLQAKERLAAWELLRGNLPPEPAAKTEERVRVKHDIWLDLYAAIFPNGNILCRDPDKDVWVKYPGKDYDWDDNHELTPPEVADLLRKFPLSEQAGIPDQRFSTASSEGVVGVPAPAGPIASPIVVEVEDEYSSRVKFGELKFPVTHEQSVHEAISYVAQRLNEVLVRRVEESRKSELISCPKCGVGGGKPCLCDLPNPPRNIFTDPKDGDRFKVYGEERICKGRMSYDDGGRPVAAMLLYYGEENVSDIRRVDDPPATPAPAEVPAPKPKLESRLAAAVEALKAVGRCECGDGSFHEWQPEKGEVVKVVCPQCNGTCYDPRAYAIIKSEESHEGK